MSSCSEEKRRSFVALCSSVGTTRHLSKSVFHHRFPGPTGQTLAQPCTGGLAGFWIRTGPPPEDGRQASDTPSPFASPQMKGSSGAQRVPTVISKHLLEASSRRLTVGVCFGGEAAYLPVHPTPPPPHPRPPPFLESPPPRAHFVLPYGRK